jgi:hypothetical protein
MRASFSTDGGTLEWNVHSHQGEKAVIHAQGSDPSGQPSFVAEQDGLYSFLWKNESDDPVQLKVELRIEGQGKVHSTVPK